MKYGLCIKCKQTKERGKLEWYNPPLSTRQPRGLYCLNCYARVRMKAGHNYSGSIGGLFSRRAHGLKKRLEIVKNSDKSISPA